MMNNIIQSNTTKLSFVFRRGKRSICLMALIAAILICWMMIMMMGVPINKSLTDLTMTKTNNIVVVDMTDSIQDDDSFSLHWKNLWETFSPKINHQRSKDEQEQDQNDLEKLIYSDKVLLNSEDGISSSSSTDLVVNSKITQVTIDIIEEAGDHSGSSSDIKPYSLFSKSSSEEVYNPSTPGLDLVITYEQDREGIFGYLSKWIQLMDVSKMKIHLTELMSKNQISGNGSNNNDDVAIAAAFAAIDAKSNSKKVEPIYYNEENKNKGGRYLRFSSNSGGGHPLKNDQDTYVDKIMEVNHRSSSSKALQYSFNIHDNEIDYYYKLPIDVIHPKRRVLQTNVCSNISDTFKASYVIIVTGNKSLLTEEQANLLGVVFAASYNEQISGNGIGTGTGTTTATCDPLFRIITDVQVTTNATFTGSNPDEISENSMPIIPARKLQGHLQHQSSLMDGISWESIIDGHNKDSFHRQLQQQQQQQQKLQSPFQSGLNGTARNFDVGFILFDIFGSCRGCQGNTIEFNLFDDTSSVIQQEQQERRLQDLQVTNNDCVCPADASTVASTAFQSSFNSKVEDLRDSGEIVFVEEVIDSFPALTTQCPTMSQNFSTVVLVSGMVISKTLLLSLGVEGVQQVERHFRDSYNAVAQQLCDPLYRAISNTIFVSIESEGEGSTTVQMEFVIDATCRGDDCTIDGCIFDEADSCGGNRRERKLKTNVGHPKSLFAPNDDVMILPVNSMTDNNILPQRMLQEEKKNDGNDDNIVRLPRLLQQDDNENNKKDDEEERCLCRKGRFKRPPTQKEFKFLFQTLLDEITENNKLSSCQACSFPGDCRSGLCLFGRCAEADTQLLLNSCSCSNNEECESGLCQDTSTGVNDVVGGDMLPSGTCRGKLSSCRSCNQDDECLSGFCTDGRCAEAVDGKLKTGCDCVSNLNCQTGRCFGAFISIGIFGKCIEKINNTCTEPCFLSSDCESGLCGSVVCMPLNGTLLADGCSAASNSDCQSGASENNRCTPAASQFPSLSPSQFPSFQPSKQPSSPPTSEPTFLPSTAPSTSTLSPSFPPTAHPTIEPTIPPTQSPSIFPSSTPSTSFPSMLPSPLPSESPSTPPSTVPSPDPTLDPSDSPSAPPSTIPTPDPTISPSDFPSPKPSDSPSDFPSPEPSYSPTDPPSTSPSPSVLEDCRTFPANSFIPNDVYHFCNGHDFEQCCVGPSSCNDWNLAATYTICKNSCRGAFACSALDVKNGGTVSIGVGSCQEDKSCMDFGGSITNTITIDGGSCIGISSCESIGNSASSIGIETGACLGEDLCNCGFSDQECIFVFRYFSTCPLPGCDES